MSPRQKTKHMPMWNVNNKVLSEQLVITTPPAKTLEEETLQKEKPSCNRYTNNALPTQCCKISISTTKVSQRLTPKRAKKWSISKHNCNLTLILLWRY